MSGIDALIVAGGRLILAAGSNLIGKVKIRNPGDTADMGDAANPIRVDPTGGTTQPVSAASLPLPTGAATETTLGSVVSALAGLLSTSAFQARINTLGQKAMAASTPVVVSSDQSSIPVGDGGGSLTVDATSLPLPTGAATETTLGSVLTALANLLTTTAFQARINTLGQKAMAASTPVVLSSDQTAIPITDNGGSVTVDGTVSATVSGTVTANVGTTNGLALDATLTGGTQKSINRGGAKGATTAADVTSTAEGTDHQALDVQLYHGGTAINPTQTRALTSADVVTSRMQDGAGNALAAFDLDNTGGTAFCLGVSLRGLANGTPVELGTTTAGPLVTSSYGDGRDGYQPENGATVSTGPALCHVDPDGRYQTYTSCLTDEGSFRDDFVGTSLNARWTATGTGGGTVSTPASSLVTLASPVTSGAIASLFAATVADVGPMTCTIYASCSTRQANRTGMIGLAEASDATAPGAHAVFLLTGTVATSLVCRSGASSAAADQQSTTVTLPTGLDTSSTLRYKVDVSNTQVTFSISTGTGDDIIVAKHQLHVPLNTSVLGPVAALQNTAAAAGTCNLVLDAVHFANWNRLQIDTDYRGEPIPVQISSEPVLQSGTLNALNAAVTIAIGSNNSIGMALSAGNLIGTIAAEASYNNGLTWEACTFNSPTAGRDSSLVFAAANTAQNRTIPLPGGATHARVRVSAFTSGSAAVELRTVPNNELGVQLLQGTRAVYVVGVSGQANTAASQSILIEASATRRVLIRKLIIMHPGTQTTAGLRQLILERTTAAGAGGTTITADAANAAGAFLTRFDSKDGAFGGICRAKPTTLGTQGSTLWLGTIFVPTTLAAFVPVTYDFEALFGKPLVIQPGTTNGIALRDPGAAGAANFAAQIVFTEE